MSIIDNVFGFFVEEANDHLRTLEEGLLQLEIDTSQAERLMEPLLRAAHTLKGAANLMNVTDVGAVAHRLEDLLEAIGDGEHSLTRARVDAMLFSLDQMRELIHLRKSGEEIPAGLVTEALSRMAEADRMADEADQFYQLQPEEPENFVGNDRRNSARRIEDAGAVRVSMDKIESMMGLVGEFTLSKNHLLGRLPVLESIQEEISSARKRLLKEVAGFTEQYNYTLPTRNAGLGDAAFDELEFDRYDELNLFSRKLREITDDIEAAMKEISGFFKVFSQDIFSFERMTDDLKELISSVRTIQAGELFQRFNRAIRDLSGDLNKPVELCISGGETPIDRVIYDGLFDPLLHIVRNSLAHGIETAEERVESGKPIQGTIWLKAERRGNTVEISVEDDGCGINLERVRERGIEKGFIGVQDHLSEQDLIQLIFRPGFSTTTTADSKSGRGVGMSVVRDRLSRLNGTIEVWTKKGRGTKFRLRLPLSLVIVNVIHFSCSKQQLVIPTALVDEIIDLRSAAIIGGADNRYENIQKIDLGRLLNLPAQEGPQEFGIVTQSEGTPIMLLVDTVLGQEDTVIKPFGSFLDELQFFSGTSLAGDGSMRLVVNPARMKYETAEIAGPAVAPVKLTPAAPKVLVVDDSLSVRKYADMLLSAKGYSVVTAVNGQEALDRLDHENIFSIITDLEMPIMHGYELLRELQRKQLRIPVAVLTSRGGEQHRNEALSLGATDYLVKPFDEDGLIDVVRRHQELV